MIEQQTARAPTSVDGADIRNNAILYARQSVKKKSNGEISFSIEGQLDAMREFAVSRGLNVVQEYQENQSGATLNRPILSQVRTVIKDPNVNYLIVDRLDRLTRGGDTDLMILLKEFEIASVTLLTVRMEFDSSTAEGRLNILTMALLGNYQLELIKENQEAVRLSQLRQHKAISPAAPFGYYYDTETGHYLIKNNEAKIVRLIFKLHVERRYGASKILEIINNTFDKQLQIHVVNNVLKRAQKYAGHYHHVKYGDYNYVYPAIITDELAQQSTEIRLESTYDRTNEFWLLRRKIICPYCKGKLSTHKVGKNRYYNCVRNGKHKALGTINIPAREAEQLVSSTIKFVLGKPSIKQKLDSKIAESKLSERQLLQRQKQAATQKTNALIQKFSDGAVTETEFKTELRKIQANRMIRKPTSSLKELIERFKSDKTYQLRVIKKLIDHVEVNNVQDVKTLTGIFIESTTINQLKQPVKLK